MLGGIKLCKKSLGIYGKLFPHRQTSGIYFENVKLWASCFCNNRKYQENVEIFHNYAPIDEIDFAVKNINTNQDICLNLSTNEYQRKYKNVAENQTNDESFNLHLATWVDRKARVIFPLCWIGFMLLYFIGMVGFTHVWTPMQTEHKCIFLNVK